MPKSSFMLRLPASRGAPAQARRQLVERCSGLPADVLGDASLLVSELVTNAAVHARTMITVAVECDKRAIAVAVGDDSETPPVMQGQEPHAVGGRGLQLVDQLATGWGHRPQSNGGGKVVWFCIDR